MSKERTVRRVTTEADREHGRKVCAGFSEKELFELPTAEKLARMTVQRSIADVIAECDIAFCPYCKIVEGIESVMSDDPLKAALDHARENDVNCLAFYDKYYAIVPSFKSDMKGWGDAFNVWNQMRIEGALG